MNNTSDTQRDWFSGRVSSVLFYKISLLYSSFNRIVTHEAARESLTNPQFKVLSIIGSFGPLPATHISKSLTMDQAAMSRIVRQLLDLDLIVRKLSETDGRVAEISLSRRGVKVYERIATRLDVEQEKLLSSFDVSERDVLMESIDRLLRVTFDSE